MKYIRDTIIKPIGITKTNRQHAIFLCPQCGKQVEKPKKDGKNAKTCGCKKRYLEETIGNFFVIDDDLKGRDRRLFLTKCLLCGNEKEILAQSILNGKIVSCGCQSVKLSIKKNTKHDMSNHRLYKTWYGMIQRCYNKKHESYKYYGKKGVKVCKKWHKVENFINDMGETYKESLTLDRIENSKNYEKENCRWSSKLLQSRNRRKIMATNTSGYRGVTKNKTKWSASISVNKKKIHLGTFDTKLGAAKAYDNYIKNNKLEHTRNF